MRLLCSVAIVQLLSTASAGRFWHISDLHYDPKLVELKRSCVQPVADIPEWSSEFCDANIKLIDSALAAMKRIEPNPDFIIWTGDSALHYWNGTVGTADEIVLIVTELSRRIDEQFPGAKVIASLGNHDFVPDNQLPAVANEIYRNVSAVWRELGWLDGLQGELDSFDNYGYYAVSLSPKLMAMAMNTNFYYRGNKVFESEEVEDPGEQFMALENLLKNASASSAKVIISAHVPFGVGAQGKYVHMYDKYNARFVSLVQQYHSAVAGLYFGHEHDDSFKLVPDSAGNPLLVAYLAPSVSPWRWIVPGVVSSPYHNPAVTLCDYDASANLLKERTQYTFDLRAANSGEDVDWTENYRFTTLFGVADASVASAQKAAELIASGKKFADYLTIYYAKPTVADFSCNDTCRHGMGCAIQQVELNKVDECLKSYQPINMAAQTAASAILLVTISLVWFS